MPGRSTARRPGYGRRSKSAPSATARPTPPAESGVALVSPTERHPRPARGVGLPVCRCVRRGGTWPWLAHGRVCGWQAPLSLVGMCSPTAVRRAHQNAKAAEPAKRLVRAVGVDAGGATVRPHPDKGSALQPSNRPGARTMTSVCAGHGLGGATRRNRSGDPILRRRVVPVGWLRWINRSAFVSNDRWGQWARSSSASARRSSDRVVFG
jgi:hypothetical protein